MESRLPERCSLNVWVAEERRRWCDLAGRSLTALEEPAGCLNGSRVEDEVGSSVCPASCGDADVEARGDCPRCRCASQQQRQGRTRQRQGMLSVLPQVCHCQSVGSDNGSGGWRSDRDGGLGMAVSDALKILRRDVRGQLVRTGTRRLRLASADVQARRVMTGGARNDGGYTVA